MDIEKAVEKYRVKFGEEPEYCYIKEGREGEVNGIRVRLKSSVLRGHLWIGCYEESCEA